MRPYRLLILRTALLVLGAPLLHATPSMAQFPEARTIRKGLLRFGFEAFYTSYDRRFALGSATIPDGEPELLGADLTADTVGSNLFPTLLPIENAIRRLTDDTAYRLNIGRFNTVREADIRRFPFGLMIGLTDRITLRATVPLVTVRSQVAFLMDSTEANVGWNPAIAELSDEATANEVAALLAQLGTAAAEVQARIAAGDYGCPSEPTCGSAQETVDRAQTLVADLALLTGLAAGGGSSPFAPLASSAAGMAILEKIATVTADLAQLGAAPVTASFPLPAEAVGTEGINALFSNEAFGLGASPLEFMRATKIGDVEAGLRIGILDSPTLRATLFSSVRFPTGTPDDPDHFTDLSIGDGQMDVDIGLETFLAPSASAGLALSASYTLQLSDQLERRVAVPDSALVPASWRFLTNRDLGDVLRISAFPTLQLADGFRVYASVQYLRKGVDRFSLAGGSSDGSVVPVMERLERETEWTSLSIGGGLAYRRTAGGTYQLPIEAGIGYQSAFTGSGGLTPKANDLRVYLRLFYRLFGAPPSPAPEPEPAPTQ